MRADKIATQLKAAANPRHKAVFLEKWFLARLKLTQQTRSTKDLKAFSELPTPDPLNSDLASLSCLTKRQFLFLNSWALKQTVLLLALAVMFVLFGGIPISCNLGSKYCFSRDIGALGL